VVAAVDRCWRLTAFFVSKQMTPIQQTSSMLVNQTQNPRAQYNDILTSERPTNTYAHYRAAPSAHGRPLAFEPADF
jgi:hypothetical protein